MGAVLGVAVGSAVGGVLRYWANEAARSSGRPFSVSTLAVNLAGAALLGAVMRYSVLRPDLPAEWRLALTAGLCGGLTTFSGFSWDVVQLLERGALARAALYAGASVGGSLLALALGMWTVSALVRPA